MVLLLIMTAFGMVGGAVVDAKGNGGKIRDDPVAISLWAVGAVFGVLAICILLCWNDDELTCMPFVKVCCVCWIHGGCEELNKDRNEDDNDEAAAAADEADPLIAVDDSAVDGAGASGYQVEARKNDERRITMELNKS
tara:strand:+ start:131 stop:544 length:414 start_codon:yes stop_codon:yes gene_type:complete